MSLENILFLTEEDLQYFHHREVQLQGQSAQLVSNHSLSAIVEAPKATFEDQFMMDIFEMAATYITSTVIRHPFTDGNKRLGLVAALVFLRMNGYAVKESHPEELADLILGFLAHKLTKEDISLFLKLNSQRID